MLCCSSGAGNNLFKLQVIFFFKLFFQVLDDGDSLVPSVFLQECQGITLGLPCQSDEDCAKAGSFCTSFSRCSVPCNFDDQCATGNCFNGQCYVPIDISVQNELFLSVISLFLWNFWVKLNLLFSNVLQCIVEHMHSFDKVFLQEYLNLPENSTIDELQEALINHTLEGTKLHHCAVIPD